MILLILFGMPVISDSLLLALASGLPMTPPADHPPQAIVVLGAEVIRAHNEKLGIRPGLLTLDRLRAAAILYRRTGLPILVTGGTTQPNTAAVGLVMDESLTDDFLTPPRWVEAKSVDTWENARFSADILRAEGITSVYVVTHAWHMRRAILAFQESALPLRPFPLHGRSPRSRRFRLPPTRERLAIKLLRRYTNGSVMRGIYCADLGITTFPTIRDLFQPDVLALLDDITSPFTTLPWWNVVVAHAIASLCRDHLRCDPVPWPNRGGRAYASSGWPVEQPDHALYLCLSAADRQLAWIRSTRIAAMSAFARYCRPAGSFVSIRCPRSGTASPHWKSAPARLGSSL